jgi:hypothetical protein
VLARIIVVFKPNDNVVADDISIDNDIYSLMRLRDNSWDWIDTGADGFNTTNTTTTTNNTGKVFNLDDGPTGFRIILHP